MELELGLKITHTREDDDLTSRTDLRITMDQSGPVFVSKETETKFILIAHLTGFRKENIRIEINEDGSRIAISGRKPVQEMVLVGWIMQKREVEIRAFRKVFRIPNGVILDKIKANFNDESSDLTISMSKYMKGFCGFGIEEVEEEQMRSTAADKEIRRKSKVPGKMEETNQVLAQKVIDKEGPKKEVIEEKIEGKRDSGQVVEQAIDLDKELPERGDMEKMKEKPEESEEKVDGVEFRTSENAAEKVEGFIKKESEEPEVKARQENDQDVERSSEKPEMERQASLEKVEPPVVTEAIQENAALKPEEQADGQAIQTQETQEQKLPKKEAPELGSGKHVSGPEITKSTEYGDDEVTKQSEFTSSSSAQDEEKQTTNEDYHVESEKPGELQKQGSSTEIQELKKLEEPSQEPELEETQGVETKEEETGEESQPQEEVDEHESHELEKQRGPTQADAAKMKKNGSRRAKVCPPLVVAGSALSVSLLVLLFHLIRSKKR
ncbi:HSP20 domain-containing protein [Melia azedarach]|uniref:HSP20 domain-containing protein n=1 Tax=Melia azedarach TaxID=155640 RepID=A0ACC1WPA3_MELAZ|nr:HSP20 domain-containing protein [Melia azedarach]